MEELSKSILVMRILRLRQSLQRGATEPIVPSANMFSPQRKEDAPIEDDKLFDERPYKQILVDRWRDWEQWDQWTRWDLIS